MAGESGDFLRRLRRTLLDWSAWKAGRGVERTRQAGRDMLHGGRFHCAGCNRDFRGHRAMNAHHAAVHAGRWGGAKARKAGRAMGKEVDRMRRHARGWLEAAGLRDQQGTRTARARSRPEARGRLTRGHLRRLHDHDRDHERAGRHDRRAARHRARGNEEKALGREHRAAGLRDRWPERTRTAPAAANGTRPEPARTAPAPVRPVPADGNGTRPERTRTPR